MRSFYFSAFFLISKDVRKYLCHLILEDTKSTQLRSAENVAVLKILQESYGLEYVQRQMLEPVSCSTPTVLVSYKYERLQDTFAHLYNF